MKNYQGHIAIAYENVDAFPEERPRGLTLPTCDYNDGGALIALLSMFSPVKTNKKPAETYCGFKPGFLKDKSF